ncbi:hypothetical protein ACJ72_05589 [Emergomyces africanus]|uniref:Uncharacterized protein n=1 Tax=Emergomyces africanus TaxID=1955775 RepID=A0A1B7NTJ5_9EURO|nr:hypothetical protein ACJ72_05589 [Emergomyces africanus]
MKGVLCIRRRGSEKEPEKEDKGFEPTRACDAAGSWIERKGEDIPSLTQVPMDLYFSLAEKRLAAAIALVWVSSRFGLTLFRLLRRYLNRAVARRRQLRHSPQVNQDQQRAETDDATASRT